MQEDIDTYKTLKLPSQGIFKDKGSKFLAFAYPVYTENEIKIHLLHLRKEYFDARHHCYAYALGRNREVYRTFDDGEPSGTAGKPIYGQILSTGLTNVLIIVVRYFGGVKLGVGGLISAYKLAAEEALNKAIIIEKEVTEPINLVYSYSATPEVMRLVKEYDLNILQQHFDTECVLLSEVKIRYKAGLLEKIALLQATGHEVRID